MSLWQTVLFELSKQVSRSSPLPKVGNEQEWRVLASVNTYLSSYLQYDKKIYFFYL